MRDAPPVVVRLVYLARLREALGRGDESLQLPAGQPSTVAGVLAALRARGGAYADELALGRAVRVAINHTTAKPGDTVHDGDEVALFPPVTGG